MNHKLIRVKAKTSKLTCWFEDGSVVEFDMSKILKRSGPMIKPLKKKAFFEKAFIESGSVIWPNGFDICPNLIYQKGFHLPDNKAAA